MSDKIFHNCTKADLAWIAGFYEGEGSVVYKMVKSFDKPRGYPNGCFSITQVNKEPLEKCLALTGLGYMTGPYKPRQNNHNSYYRWVAQEFESFQALVAAIWPWLSRKRKDQIKSAMRIRLDHYRRPKGLYGNTRITEEQARRAKFGSEPVCSLASEFGVTESAIYRIRQGNSWQWLQ